MFMLCQPHATHTAHAIAVQGIMSSTDKSSVARVLSPPASAPCASTHKDNGDVALSTSTSSACDGPSPSLSKMHASSSSCAVEPEASHQPPAPGAPTSAPAPLSKSQLKRQARREKRDAAYQARKAQLKARDKQKRDKKRLEYQQALAQATRDGMPPPLNPLRRKAVK